MHRIPSYANDFSWSFKSQSFCGMKIRHRMNFLRNPGLPFWFDLGRMSPLFMSRSSQTRRDEFFFSGQRVSDRQDVGDFERATPHWHLRSNCPFRGFSCCSLNAVSTKQLSSATRRSASWISAKGKCGWESVPRNLLIGKPFWSVPNLTVVSARSVSTSSERNRSHPFPDADAQFVSSSYHAATAPSSGG